MSDTVVTDARIGRVLQDRYRVLSRLASGGMGVVYRAERLELGRPVAIKFLHPWIASDPDFKRRFDLEARAMSRLSHPCCVPVIDFGIDGDSPYMVMELATGQTLRELVREGPLEPARAISLCRQVLAGLAHAHEQGITHRDVKPENVLVSQSAGLPEQARILDFGLAKLRDRSSAMTVGLVLGTPGYMAPEQAIADVVDHRADLYSAGVVLFELLTGRPPFQGEDASSIIRAQRTSAPPPLSTSGSSFSPQLAAAVAKALAPAPEARFETAAEMSAALEAVPEHGSIRAPLPSMALPVEQPSARSQKSALPRRTVMLAAAGVVGALLLVALAIGLSGSDGEGPGSGGSPTELTEEAKAELAQVQKLLEAHRAEQALALAARLKKRHPESPLVWLALGRANFEDLRWVDGLAAYREAIRRDEALKGNPELVWSLIRCLDSDRYHQHCVEFLKAEIGAHATPYLEEAAKHYPLRDARSRAARLLQAGWPPGEE